MTNEARDYDEYERLKNEAWEPINENNAIEAFQKAKEEVLELTKELDIENITQIEDLYLTVVKLTHSASYICAKNKASERNISFDDALVSVGTDDVISKLQEGFASSTENLSTFAAKFIEIDQKYQPTKEPWAALHARMLSVVEEGLRQSEKILNSLQEYHKHLTEKCKKEGVNTGEKKEQTNLTPVQQKLSTRYNIINNLVTEFKDKSILNTTDINKAKNAVTECLKLRPAWSERSFLKKLTDILSIGIKPLIRSFFSKEKKHQKNIEDVTKSPKM